MSERGVIGRSLYYPFEAKDRLELLLKGFGLLLLSFLIVPIFTFFGYTLKMREASARGEDAPRMTDYTRLTKEGLLGALAFVPLIFVYLFFGVVGAVLAQISPVLSQVVNFVLFLGVGYVVPAIATRYALSRNIDETYSNLDELYALLTTRTYLVGWVKYIVLSVVLAVVYILLSITVIGIVVAYPYLYYVRNAYWGDVYREAKREATTE